MTSGLGHLKSNRGAVAVIAAIMLIVLVGFTALAIDVGHLYLVRGELKNAADAGALAGAHARNLLDYDSDGKIIIKPSANVEAQLAARENVSDNTFVEVNYDPNNDNVGDVEGSLEFCSTGFQA